MLKGLPFLSFLKALAQLVRLPNVLIITLTQVLLRYCFILPCLYSEAPDSISPLPDFLLLVFVTVLIAVGGYVINDYFDVKIDRINRPGSMVVNKLISGHTAIKLHILLNGIAILLGFFLAWRIKAISFGFVFPFISGLLWIYSAKYKRMLLWGNIIVSALSSCVIIIVLLCEFFRLRLNPDQFTAVIPDIHWVTQVFLAYSTFAFLVSMVREIIKDMEDAEGDKTAGCKTLPLVAGMENTRIAVAAILFITIIFLGYAMIILYSLGLYLAFGYFIIAVQCTAFYLLVKLFYARKKRDYHYLSRLSKLIMVAGILSMGVIFISK